MKVKELAENLNTTPDTVRYYARLGLLHPKKSENGYKYFSEADKVRLQFILNTRSLGFSVSDIKNILTEADSGRTACPMVRELIQQRLDETERQFQEMLKLRENMKSALTAWDDMDDRLPTPDMVCHLIGTLHKPHAGVEQMKNKLNKEESKS
jgi:DNA-binding transcriptional MerR regulator